MEEGDILNKWLGYIEELHHDERGPLPNLLNIDGGPKILKEEVHSAFRSMKFGKAPGPDNIPSDSELIAALDNWGAHGCANGMKLAALSAHCCALRSHADTIKNMKEHCS